MSRTFLKRAERDFIFQFNERCIKKNIKNKQEEKEKKKLDCLL
jgi:hypothetical protein